MFFLLTVFSFFLYFFLFYKEISNYVFFIINANIMPHDLDINLYLFRNMIFVVRREIHCCETEKETHMGGHKDLDFLTIT